MSTERALLPLPMFPLNAVLFPHMLLPLHVFEPRYRALTRDCLRHGLEFGVVLIERGSEVGGGDSRFPVGTVARIREAAEFPDGRWAVAAVGTSRIRIATWLPDDPYPLALVEVLPDRELPSADDRLLTRAERAVRRGLALASELGDAAPPPTFVVPDDPDRAVWVLAAHAPVGAVDRQRLLATDDPADRLELLAILAEEAADVLAFRLAGG